MNNDGMTCPLLGCRTMRKTIFKEDDIIELEKQSKQCEMCNNIVNNKDTSNTYNSVLMRYKKLQIAHSVGVVTTN